MKVFILGKDIETGQDTIQIHKLTLDEQEAEGWLKESLENIVAEGEVSVNVVETSPGTEK